MPIIKKPKEKVEDYVTAVVSLFRGQRPFKGQESDQPSVSSCFPIWLTHTPAMYLFVRTVVEWNDVSVSVTLIL